MRSGSLMWNPEPWNLFQQQPKTFQIDHICHISLRIIFQKICHCCQCLCRWKWLGWTVPQTFIICLFISVPWMSLFRSCRATGGGKTFRIHNLLPSFFISLIRKFKTPWDKSEQTVIFWKQIMPKMAWRSFSKSILTLLSQIWKYPSWTEYSSKKSRKNFTSTAKSVWSADSAISNIQDLRSRPVLLITYWTLLCVHQ